MSFLNIKQLSNALLPLALILTVATAVFNQIPLFIAQGSLVLWIVIQIVKELTNVETKENPTNKEIFVLAILSGIIVLFTKQTPQGFLFSVVTGLAIYAIGVLIQGKDKPMYVFANRHLFILTLLLLILDALFFQQLIASAILLGIIPGAFITVILYRKKDPGNLQTLACFVVGFLLSALVFFYIYLVVAQLHAIITLFVIDIILLFFAQALYYRKNQTKKEVCMISTWPPIKGISPYTTHLCYALSQHQPVRLLGFKDIYPEFLYPGGTKEQTLAAYKNVQTYELLKWYNPITWILAGLIPRRKDIVHIQWWTHILFPIYFVITLVLRIRRIPYTLTVHNVNPHEKNSLYIKATAFLAKRAKTIIVHSKRNKLAFTIFYGYERKTHIIPHGLLQPLTTHAAQETPFIQRYRLALGPHKERIKLLLYGNGRKYKGLSILLQALQHIKKHKDWVLVVAGKQWHKQHIPKTLQKHVVILDEFVPSQNTAEVFRTTDLCLLPYTTFESASGVAMNALYFGKPLIVSDVGSLPEYVKQQHAIVPANNPVKLAQSILWAMQPKVLSQLEKDSVQLQRKYSWIAIAKKTLEVYKQ